SSRSIEDHALYGLLIVDEAEPIDVDRDVALIIDAWTLGADGRVDKEGVTYFIVNGRPSLDIPVTANERVRLRLINAAREFIILRLDRHAATVMAIDGQPAEPFPARDGRIALSPGNRLELFVDATLPPGSTAPIFVGSDGREVPLARLVYSAALPSRSGARADPKGPPANPPPQRTTRIAFVADNRGKWLIESQVLGGENGIRAWFEIT